ncbi:hypothetical protein [Occallatibacter riparius]|uniref:Uncharacterized protein n=1 Tax=Occallatibacter riparius TaxID=1002689 RepID=A0A9J7BWR3_9BACT|nr:hypothetical protein [Occallatibacter riparius]UWZ86258.1 hypothetical protein MOP44_10000 [Occallatibacter riparius]
MTAITYTASSGLYRENVGICVPTGSGARKIMGVAIKQTVQKPGRKPDTKHKRGVTNKSLYLLEN